MTNFNTNFDELCKDLIMAMEISTERDAQYFHNKKMDFRIDMTSPATFLLTMQEYATLFDLGVMATFGNVELTEAENNRYAIATAKDIVLKLGKAANMILTKEVNTMVTDIQSFRKFMIYLKGNYTAINIEMGGRATSTPRNINGQNSTSHKANIRNTSNKRKREDKLVGKYKYADYSSEEQQLFFKDVKEDCTLCVTEHGYKPSKYTKHSIRVCRFNEKQYVPKSKLKQNYRKGSKQSHK